MSARRSGPVGVQPRRSRVRALEADISAAAKPANQPKCAAAAVLADYAALPPARRNILRLMFCDPAVRARQADRESVARFVVGAFRIDAARAGADGEVTPLVEELCRTSPEFAALWRDSDVHTHGEGVKTLRHPTLGTITLEDSSFAVDGRPDLQMVVYNPAARADHDKVLRLVDAASAGGAEAAA